MISSVICISDKHRDSDFFSIQQEHVELHTSGSLFSIVLCDKDYTVLKVYKQDELAKLIGEAIANGRRLAVNKFTDMTEFYYLAKR
jgi:hypothetical protein